MKKPRKKTAAAADRKPTTADASRESFSRREFMMIQYCRSLKRMGKENVLTNPNFQMAGVIFLLGTILLITLIGDIILL